MRSRLARPPVLTASLLLLAAMSAAPAHALSTLNLRWDACLGDGGVSNKSFACNTNTGVNVLVGSWVTPVDLFNVTGNQVVVDLGTFGPVLPAWWEFKNAGTCRQGSLAVSAAAAPTAVNCADWSSGLAIGLLSSYIIGIKGPASARIIFATTAAIPIPDGIVAGQEYFSFQLNINHQKTVGPGACAGCDVTMCIALIAVNVTNADSRFDRQLRIGSGSGDTLADSFVLWQPVAGQTTCSRAVPVRNRTWGELKSLYR